jgi:hypothetical protein
LTQHLKFIRGLKNYARDDSYCAFAPYIKYGGYLQN